MTGGRELVCLLSTWMPWASQGETWDPQLGGNVTAERLTLRLGDPSLGWAHTASGCMLGVALGLMSAHTPSHFTLPIHLPQQPPVFSVATKQAQGPVLGPGVLSSGEGSEGEGLGLRGRPAAPLVPLPSGGWT